MGNAKLIRREPKKGLAHPLRRHPGTSEDDLETEAVDERDEAVRDFIRGSNRAEGAIASRTHDVEEVLRPARICSRPREESGRWRSRPRTRGRTPIPRVAAPDTEWRARGAREPGRSSASRPSSSSSSIGLVVCPIERGEENIVLRLEVVVNGAGRGSRLAGDVGDRVASTPLRTIARHAAARIASAVGRSVRLPSIVLSWASIPFSRHLP